MAKDPAVLFYVPDFLTGSALLTPIQKGHYITLLCYQQQSSTGSLSLEEIKSLMKKDFVKHWPILKKKFEEDNSGFFNERMKKEIEKRNKLSGRQRAIAIKRWDKIKYHGNATAVPRHKSGIEVVMPARESLSINKELDNKERETIGNATAMPRHDFETYDAEKTIAENQIEFERICMVAGKNRKEATVSLRKFHLYLEEKEQYPKSRKAVFAGFEKWLMNERKQPEPKHEKKENSGATLRKLNS